MVCFLCPRCFSAVGRMKQKMHRVTVPYTMSLADARINLKTRMWNGEEVYFTSKMSTPLQKLMVALCSRQGLALSEIRPCFDGEAFDGDRTPLDLGMKDGAVIYVLQANGEQEVCGANSWSTLTDDEARQLLPVAESAFDAILRTQRRRSDRAIKLRAAKAGQRTKHISLLSTLNSTQLVP